MITSVFVVVFYFANFGVAVAPLVPKHLSVHATGEACAKAIPNLRRQWGALNLPPPDKATCEKVELTKVGAK